MADRPAYPRSVGRYLLFDEIASGGMASVHYGRMTGAAGFVRTVAIKRLHRWLAHDPEFVSMFIDEARLASRIGHPNVVTPIDVVKHDGEMLLVMEYVVGASLSYLERKVVSCGEAIPPAIAVAVLCGALAGLHAAHEARSDTGELLGVVHRDVSPQNILVGVDGVARVVDFGIAKAVGRLQTTRDGQLKGKSAYMAPEQIRGTDVDRRTDIYAASVVLWEALVGQRLFQSDHPLGVMNAVFEKRVPKVSAARPTVPSALDAIVAKGLARDPNDRFETAREMVIALERALPAASAREVGDWVESEARDTLARRAHRVAEIESSSDSVAPVIPAAEPHDTEVGALPLPAGTDARTSSSHVSDARPRRSGNGLAVVSAALALLCVVLSISLWRAAQKGTPAPASPAAEPAVSADPSSSSPPPPPPGLEADPSSRANPFPEAAAPQVPATGSRSPAIVPRVAVPPKHGAPLRSPGPSCNPPYTVDPDGTRHWKVGC